MSLEGFLSFVDEGRPAWQADAACRGHGADAGFFPERGDSLLPARRICATCPVAQECLEYGLREKHGVWGGLSERERRRLRRQRTQERAA